jgi:uncharacterized protein YecE (DUF72 family)
MIWVGTSGFQYPEWKGKFYPEKMSAAKMLPFYAEHFSTTEVNYSFYRIPSEKTLNGWCAATPSKFRFSFKAPKQVTHILQLKNAGETMTRFETALKVANAKMGIVLFQLPPSLKKDLPLLQDFLEILPLDLNSAFEFRHASWFDDNVFAALKSKDVALCIADSEKLHTPPVATADFGYFRLRDEGYGEKEIASWSKIVAEHGKTLKDVYVYFKHEESGIGPDFAKQMMANLDLK